MGATRERDSREEIGSETQDRVQLAIKENADSSIFLCVRSHPACQISEQAVPSPLLLRVFQVEKLRLERKVGRTLCPLCPSASSRNATSSAPFASLTSSCGHLLGR